MHSSLHLLLLTSAVAVAAEESVSHNLTFMFITSFGQFGFNSSGALPAADIALEDVNKNHDVLPGYNLRYDEVRDSQVRANIPDYLSVCSPLI